MQKRKKREKTSSFKESWGSGGSLQMHAFLLLQEA
jgi:hypothetical protein